MRTIKFRFFDLTMNSYRVMDGMHDRFFIHRDGSMSYYNLQDGSGGSEYVIEQFTGLLDKNGKEIFEGDLIKSRMYNRPYSKYQKWYDVIGEVLWDDGKMEDGFIHSEPSFRVYVLKKPDAANGH